MDIFQCLALAGGLAMFLFGMSVMSGALEDLSGSKLERILEKLTSNKLKGLSIGLLVTGVIQSSSATTVMVVGFVNSGIMKLRQAIGIIMGANIGTTVTAWILSLAGIQGDSIFVKLLKPASFTPVLALIGIVILMMPQKRAKKEIGMILLGFSVLMYGMDAMSAAVKPLANNPDFANVLTMFSNPLLGVLTGLVVTAVIQSSSASVGILQALSVTGAISFGSAIPIILGQNIGTCATVMISSVGANKNAKRAALIHLYFNIIGTVVFLILFYIINSIVKFGFINEVATPAGIAIVHSLFNIFTTILFLPFTAGLEKMAYLTVKPAEDEDRMLDDFMIIDERFLSIPAFAIEQCRNLVVKMAEISFDALSLSFKMLSNYDKADAEKLLISEKRVDAYEDKLGAYLIKIRASTHKENQAVSLLLHCISDFERISDHAQNIYESAKERHKKELAFSGKAEAELKIFIKAVEEITRITLDAFKNENLDKARLVEPLEQVVDNLQIELKKRHIKRLRKGKCSIETGILFSDILTNMERVADHCSNIAIYLIQISENKFERHEYLNELRNKQDDDFMSKYIMYNGKYMLP